MNKFKSFIRIFSIVKWSTWYSWCWSNPRLGHLDISSLRHLVMLDVFPYIVRLSILAISNTIVCSSEDVRLLSPTVATIPFFTDFIRASDTTFRNGKLADMNLHSSPLSVPISIILFQSYVFEMFLRSLDAATCCGPLSDNTMDGMV